MSKTRSLRVLYMLPGYWPAIGGAELLSRELLRQVAKQYSVRVVTQYAGDQPPRIIDGLVQACTRQYDDDGVPVDQIGPGGAWQPVLRRLAPSYNRIRLVNPLVAWMLDAAMAPKLRAIVLAFRPDVIHAVLMGLVYSSEMAFRVARRLHVPFVWTTFPHIETGGWRGPRFDRLYRQADAAIAMTTVEKEWLQGIGVASERIHIIPMGPLVNVQAADPAAFRAAYGLGDAPVVLFLGRKVLYKGYAQIVQAAQTVWASIPETRFVFVGSATRESDQLLKTADARILDLPSFAPYSAEKSSALAACDVMCLPSSQESLGAAYLEAWSFHRPVIAANIRVAREVIAEGKEGLLVDPTPDAISDAILRILLDPDLKTRLGEAGYQKVQRQYNWSLIADKTIQVYRSLQHS